MFYIVCIIFGLVVAVYVSELLDVLEDRDE